MNNQEAARLSRQHLARAQKAQHEGRVGYALRDFRRAVALHPTPQGYTALARALALLGRYEESIARCQSAIGLDPDFGPAYTALALALIQQERWEQAQSWLELALSTPHDPSRGDALYHLGRCHQHAGRFLDARRCFQKALQEQITLEAAADALVLVTRLLN